MGFWMFLVKNVPEEIQTISRCFRRFSHSFRNPSRMTRSRDQSAFKGCTLGESGDFGELGEVLPSALALAIRWLTLNNCGMIKHIPTYMVKHEL